MDEVAPLSIYAKPLLSKVITVLCLVFIVRLLVFKQFVRTVCELSSSLIGTVSEFDKLLAEFGFLLAFLGVNNCVRERTQFRRERPLISVVEDL